MNEVDAVEKMRELQDSLSAAMKFSSARDRFPTLFIIALMTLLGSALIILFADFYDFVSYSPQLGTFPIFPDGGYIYAAVPVAFLWLFVLYLEYHTLMKAYRRSIGVNWENELEEGVLGILKIVENEDWEDILNHLRRAKQSFLVLGIIQFTINWVFASVILWFFYGFVVEGVFGVPINSIIVLPLAAILVLILGDRSLRKGYNRLWQMDNLIMELRWFFLEFQGSGILA